MKRVLLFLSFVSMSPVIVMAGDYMSLDDAVRLVSYYYSVIKETVDRGYEDLVDEDYDRMFGKDVNGNSTFNSNEKFPNDLFELIDVDTDKVKSPRSFFADIEDMVKNNDVKFNYKCIGRRFCRQPGFGKTEYAHVFFEKEWIVNGIITVIVDTVSVNLKYKHISQIWNQVVPLNGSLDMSLEQMKAKSAGMYDKGTRLGWYGLFGIKDKERRKYCSKSAEIYKKIIKEYPDDGDAFYRLAALYTESTWWGKPYVDDNIEREDRRDLVLNYLCKSLELTKDDPQKSKEIQRGISYITDGRSINCVYED